MRFFAFLFCCHCLTVSAQWFSPPFWQSPEYSAYANRLAIYSVWPDSAVRNAVYDIFETHGMFSDQPMQELTLQYLVVKGQVQSCVMKNDSCPAALDSLLNLKIIQQLLQQSGSGPVVVSQRVGDTTPASRDSVLLGISFPKLKWKLLPERFGIRDDIQLMYPENQVKLQKKLTQKANQKKLFKPGETVVMLYIKARLKPDGHLEHAEVLNRGKEFSVLVPLLQRYLRFDSFIVYEPEPVCKPVASLNSKPYTDVWFYWNLFSDNRWHSGDGAGAKQGELRRRTKLYLAGQSIACNSGTGYTGMPTSLSNTLQFRAGKTIHETLRLNDSTSLQFYWTHLRESGKTIYMYKAYLETNGKFTDGSYYSQIDLTEVLMQSILVIGNNCNFVFLIYREND